MSGYSGRDGFKVDAWAWVCIGSIRGWCGTHHRTVETCLACIDRDQEGCNAQSRDGYSDRSPRVAQYLGRGTWTTPERPQGVMEIDLMDAQEVRP